ncbi:MAG: dTDP-4-dehydrorhamnose 3,5-epimerase family protein, partial [Microcystis sp. M49637_WE12]|nr:dTDP-4-dehydrorhamnose 3,5-epimerase family protein [Microcystis sp. M49637_WE12]
IAWNDADLGIDWPLEVPPILSPKDQAGQPFKSVEVFP